VKIRALVSRVARQQITLRRIDGRRKIAAMLVQHAEVAA
jgi:hypothetical protein